MKHYNLTAICIALSSLLLASCSSGGANNDSPSNTELNSPTTADGFNIPDHKNKSKESNTYITQNSASIVSNITSGNNINNATIQIDYQPINLYSTEQYNTNNLKQATFSFYQDAKAITKFINIENRAPLYGEGFASEFLGNNLIKTSQIVDNHKINQCNTYPQSPYQSIAIPSNLKERAFTGCGVKVAEIDGQFNYKENDPNLNFLHFNNKPIAINLNSIMNYDDNYVPLAATMKNHGLVVGSIISSGNLIYGQSSSGYNLGIGLAPNTQLYYATLNKKAEYVGRVFELTYLQSHPAIINNSYYIPLHSPIIQTSTTSSILQPTTINSQLNTSKLTLNTKQQYYNISLANGDNIEDNESLDEISIGTNLINSISTENNASKDFEDSTYLDNIYNNDNFTSLKTGIDNIMTNVDAPLFVFASGNYHLQDLKASLAQTKNNNLVYSEEKLINSVLKAQNFGVEIDQNTALYKLLQNKNLASNIIVVSGGYYDPTNTQNLAQFNFKLNAISEIYGVSTEDLINKYKLHKPVVATKEQIEQGIPFNTKYFISSLGAFQCGLVMYDCVSASYQYYIPFLNNDLQISDNEKYQSNLATGTSFAAPVVSAVASLVKEQFPWMSGSNLKTTILTTATDVGPIGVDPYFGWGFVNASNALRGPAMFAFGNFYADLSGYHAAGTQPIGKHFNSYFINNISGSGGLIVDGTNLDTLYLTGNNSYTGDTIVNSGNLVLISPYFLHLTQIVDNNNPDNYANLNSNVFVNNKANFYAIYAHLNNITNNGKTILDGAVINGDFIQKPNATLVLNGLEPIKIKGKAQLSGTLALNPPTSDSSGLEFVNQNGKINIILDADKGISGHFDYKISLRPTILKNFKLIYSGNGKQLAIDTIPVSIKTASVKVASGSSILDTNVINNGAKYIDLLFKQANNLTQNHSSVNLTQANEFGHINLQAQSDSPIVKTAAIIQNSSAKELKHYFIQQAGTIYADLALASTSNSRNSISNFIINNSNSQFNNNSNYFNFYSNYSYLNTTWQNKQQDSQILGKYITSNYSVGAYGQAFTYNYGINLTLQVGAWHENLKDTDVNTSLSSLAHAKDNSYSLVLTSGKAWNKAFVNLSGFVNYHNLEVTRTAFKYKNDQYTVYNLYDLGLNLNTGYQLVNTTNHQLNLVGSISLVNYMHNGFKEHAQGTNANLSKQLSFNVKEDNSFNSYLNIGTIYSYKFNSNLFNINLKEQLDLGMNLEVTLLDQNFDLKLNNGLSTTHVFSNVTTTKFILGYLINFTDKFSTKLQVNYQQATNWYNYGVNLGFSYNY